MENNETSQFENFDKKIIVRRTLLPIWIKLFCWLFMIMGILAVGSFIFGILGKNADISLYGFETNEPFSIVGLFIIIIILFKAFCAYSLWFEKDIAIKVCKFDAVLGVLICIFSMFVMPFINENSIFTFRLEIVLLIPYFMKINKIEYQWINLEDQ